MTLSCRLLEHEFELQSRQALFCRSFPETAGTEMETDAYYNWKFCETPFTPPSFEFGAYDENELVGYYAAMPCKYVIDGKECSVAQMCDIMTDPNQRRKGVFTKISDYAMNHLRAVGIDYLFGYTARPETLHGHVKVGTEIGFALPLYIRWCSSRSVLKHIHCAWLSALIDPCLSLLNTVFIPRQSKDCQFDLVNPQQFLEDTRYTAFFSRWSSTMPRYLIKDKKFLLWRLGFPGRDYKILRTFHNEQLVAIAILRTTKLKGISSMAILDLMCLPEYSKCMPDIHGQLLNLAGKLDLDAIAIVISKTWAKRYSLFANRYFPTPFVFTFILHRLTKQIASSLLDEEKWHLMWIDSDTL